MLQYDFYTNVKPSSMGGDLKKQIDSLKTLIETEEENYKTALQSHVPFDTLKQMRSNLKKLKSDLQILLDKESVNRTGELPKDATDK